jgi:recombination protein RecR
MFPSPLEKLIRLFSRFPTIGPRTAARFAFYCLEAKNEEVEELIEALKDLKKSVKSCSLCFRSILAEETLCAVCKDKKRNRDTICVVEKETDLLSIEKTHEYDGIYFILGGTVSPLKKEDFKNIRIKELKERIENHKEFNLPKVKEVIIATNQNTEGEATAIYVARVLNDLKIKTTRLGRGLPTGGELEYTDEETLSYALKGRN